MSDLSDLSELASLSLQQQPASSPSSSEGGVHSSSSSNGGESSERSAAASTPASAGTSPSSGPNLHPSAAAFLANGGGGNGAEPVADYDTETLKAVTSGGEHRRSNGARGSRQIDPTERRTVFIPNLPRDATQRELTNMFAFCDGFVKVQLYDQKGPQEGGGAATTTTTSGASTPPAATTTTVAGGPAPLTFFGAFILFDSPAQAIFARDRLHGMVFDAAAQPPTILQARLALKNLYLSREENEQHMQAVAAAMINNSQKTSRRGSHGYANGGGGNALQQHGAVIPPSDAAVVAGYMVNGNANVVGGGAFSPLLSPQPPHNGGGGGGYIHSGYHSPALSPYGAQHQQLTPPALQQQLNGYYSDGVMSPQQHHPSLVHPQGVFSGMYGNGVGVGNGGNNGNNNGGGGGYHRHGNGYHNNNHSHNNHSHSHAGPFNAPCSTLFLARLDQLSDEELYGLLVNSFPDTLKDTKFMIDSKNQRIAFVEFDCVENASLALQRISGYCGVSCAFSKNPLGVRAK